MRTLDGAGQKWRLCYGGKDNLGMPKHNIGKRVAQPQYGPGTIIESNERHTVIDFDEHGVRRFVTEMVELESSTVPAPTKTKRTRAAKR